MSNKRFEVGQIVWCVSLDNRHRNSSKDIRDVISEWKIVKVGRKYITIRKHDAIYSHNDIQIFADTFLHNAGEYSPEYQMYLSLDDIFEEYLCIQDSKTVENVMRTWSYPRMQDSSDYDKYMQVIKKRRILLDKFIDELIKEDQEEQKKEVGSRNNSIIVKTSIEDCQPPIP